MERFIEKHQAQISGTVSCLDRILFKGHLPLGRVDAMERFISRQGLRFKDFGNFVNRHSERIKQHALREGPAPAQKQIQALAQPVRREGRSYRGFNPADAKDIRRFAAVMRGEHLFSGFSNRDVRPKLFPPQRDKVESRRQAARVSRILKRLHVHGLIAKIQRSRRWRVTAKCLTTKKMCARRDHLSPQGTNRNLNPTILTPPRLFSRGFRGSTAFSPPSSCLLVSFCGHDFLIRRLSSSRRPVSAFSASWRLK